jgi:peptidoglycan/xylan/chitin deacetylase (PgdA/CDA1 family)
VVRDVLTSMARAGGGFLARHVTAAAPRILMYHRFAAAPHPRRLEAGVFEQHLRYLTRHFQVRPLREVTLALRHGWPLPPRTVVLTVDDGYADFVACAYPLLQRYEVPATLFVTTAFVDGESWLWFDAVRWMLDATGVQRLSVVLCDAPVDADLATAALRERAWNAVATVCQHQSPAARTASLRLLQDALRVSLPPAPPAEYGAASWERLAGLDPRLVEIGSHTCSHAALSRCADDELAAELTHSRRAIEARLQRPVHAVAYPHGEPGDYDERTTAAAAAAGYDCGLVAHGGLLREGSDLFRLERLSGASGPAQFRSTVNGLELWANKVRAWARAAAF